VLSREANNPLRGSGSGGALGLPETASQPPVPAGRFLGVAVRLDLDPVEVRVLGCLVEKQRTTPDAYPLTLNSLRQACNQATNRDPVMALDEAAVRTAAQALAVRGLARFASGHSGRVAKYRHMLRDALGASAGEIALLGLLMLRGEQTPGELRARSERLHSFEEPGELDASLERLAEAGLVERLERRPGQKEARFRHLLAAAAEEEGLSAPAAFPAAPREAEPVSPPGPTERLERLEAEVARLRDDVDALRRELGA
jgi:uncharacterized protein